MIREPKRILAGRHGADAALRSDLAAFSRHPHASTLDLTLVRIRAALATANERDDDYSDSGIREVPRALRLLESGRSGERVEPLAAASPRATRRVPARALAVLCLAAAAAFCVLSSMSPPRAGVAGRPRAAEPRATATTAEPVASPATAAAPFESPHAAPSRRAARRDASLPHGRIARSTRPRRASAEQAPSLPTPEEAAGVLNINSIPITHVVLDGRPIGGTPRVQVEVSPGYHKVLFVHPEQGRKFFDVYVNPGETVLATARFR